MTLTALPPLDPTSPTFRADVDTFFSSRIQNFVSEANQMAANLNGIAAGGAYAIPFSFSDAGSIIGGGGGGIAVNDYTTQSTAATLYASPTDANGFLTKLGFDDIFYVGATSAIKGYIKLTKVGDPSKWLRLHVNSYVYTGGYMQFGVAVAGSSASNPFALGDLLIMDCQRTGDKGDTGPAYIPQAVKFSDRKPSGTAGGSAVASDATQVRTLNTTDYNTIPSGVSLSGNQFTLPAGMYDFWGRAPAWGVGNHKASLYNVTDGQIALAGSSTYASGGQASYADQTESFFSGRITLSAPKTFVVRHYTQNIGGTNALGCATSVSGQLETYTEVNVTKIA